MDLSFHALSKSDFESHCTFKLPKLTRRRNIRVDDVLPSGEGLAYFIVLDQLLISMNENLVQCSSFNALFDLLEMDNRPESLEIAMRKFQLIEMGHSLPDKAREALIEASSESRRVFIRCWQDPDAYFWEAPLASYLSEPDLLEVLPHSFGEFDIFDEGNNWYLKVADDDPFLFLCASERTISRLEKDSEDHIMKVRGSFLYAS